MSLLYEYPYLLDNGFLKKIDDQRVQRTKIKCILLDQYDREIEEVQGLIVDGNINIDGSSSLRRTGSITFCPINQSVGYNDLTAKFALNKRLLLLIGVKNEQVTETVYTQEEYPYIWFPQGEFCITGCSISHSLDNYTVSLNLVDKMGLLNGTLGGVLPATVDFSTKRLYDERLKDTVDKEVTMYQIIMEAVNHWGGEQLGKILIGDLLQTSKKVITWTQTYTDTSQPYSYSMTTTETGETAIAIDEEETKYFYLSTDDLNSTDTLQVRYAISSSPPTDWGAYKPYSNLNTVGYEITDFTYPGTLTGEAGSAVTTVLDKVRDALGNYEYFYDTLGNFRFQEVKNYLNTSLSSNLMTQINYEPGEQGSYISDTVYYYDRDVTDNNSSYIVDRTRGKVAYDFSDRTKIVAISNSPNYDNIKNDFIIQGKRKTSTGESIAIRYHLAIDKKPPFGGKYIGEASEDAYGDIIYKDLMQITEDNINTSGNILEARDWRTELFFQGELAYENGTEPGYYFSELSAFWPQIYNIEEGHYKEEIRDKPETLNYFLDFIDTTSDIGKYSVSEIGRRTKVLTNDSINCLFEPVTPDVALISPCTNFRNAIYSHMTGSGVTITNLQDLDSYFNTVMGTTIDTIQSYAEDYTNGKYVNKKDDVWTFLLSSDNPDSVLSQWTPYKSRDDFMGALSNAVIAAAKDLYYSREDQEDQIDICKETTNHYVLISREDYPSLSMKSTPNGADVAAKDLLYQYTCFNETISLTTVPIYHLEPNTLIKVKDDKTNINDLFLIKSINLSLGLGSTMTINATKALSKI